MGELTLTRCKSKIEEWMVYEKEQLRRVYKVYIGEENKLRSIEWTDSFGKEQEITNLDIRAILEIVKRGGYEL